MMDLDERVAALEPHGVADATPEPKTASRKKKCINSKHTDRLMRGGKRLECTTCGDIFPCAHECDHFDCKWERDEPGAVVTGELGHVVR